MNFLGNTNGLVSNIYYYLWMKNDTLEPNAFPVSIPDTIIYVSGLPQSWYFTSKATGQVMLRRQEHKTIEMIRDVFLHNVGQSQIVAYFLQQLKPNNKEEEVKYDLKSQRLAGLKVCSTQEALSVLYLDKDAFLSFLEDPNRPKNGILQKFIEPYASCENMIQAIWSPNVCILSKRVNYRQVTDQHYDPQERCATFGSAEVFSRTVPLKGHEISAQIRSLVNNMINKIRGVTYDKDLISRGVFYFKADENNKLFFTYCSSIRTESEEVPDNVRPRIHPTLRHYNTPVAIGENFRVAKDLKRTSTVNTLKPTKVVNDLTCFDCEKKCQTQDLYHVKFSLVISYHDYLLRRRNQEQIKEQIMKNISTKIKVQMFKPDSQPVLLTRVFNTSAPCQEIQQPPQSPQQPNIGTTDVLIPYLIRKYYPRIDLQTYSKLRSNDMFLTKSLQLCEACFIKYSSIQFRLTGVIPQEDLRAKSSQICKHNRPSKIQIDFKQVFERLSQSKVIVQPEIVQINRQRSNFGSLTDRVSSNSNSKYSRHNNHTTHTNNYSTNITQLMSKNQSQISTTAKTNRLTQRSASPTKNFYQLHKTDENHFLSDRIDDSSSQDRSVNHENNAIIPFS